MSLSQTPKTDWESKDGISTNDYNRIEQNIQDLEDTKAELNSDVSFSNVTIDSLTPNNITSATIVLGAGATYVVNDGFYMVLPAPGSPLDFNIRYVIGGTTYYIKASNDFKSGFIFANATYPATITATTAVTLLLIKVM